MNEALDFRGNPKWHVLRGEAWRNRRGMGAEGREVLDGEDLLIEDQGKLPGSLVGECFKVGQRRPRDSVGLSGCAHLYLVFQACNRAVGNAARIDQAEVAEIGGDVEGKSVRSDTAGYVNADGTDLSFPFCLVLAHRGAIPVPSTNRRAPDAGEAADASREYTVDTTETNEGLFHHAHEVYGPETVAVGIAQTAEVEDGVSDELAGTVIGNVASSVDFVESDTTRREQLSSEARMLERLALRPSAENSRMFEE